VLVRLGSRGSRLALTQAELAGEALRRANPDLDVALVPITTTGDRDRSKPFGEIGARGVFVKEIEESLLEGRIDVAVHSAKDMTSTDTNGIVVGAYLTREDPRDALCGAERACVARIGAGCLAPVAAHHDGEALTALIAAEDGSWIERRRGQDPEVLADALLAAAAR